MAHKYLKEDVVLRHRDVPNIADIDVYLANDGYEGLKKALTTMEPGQVTEIVKAAGLRGRGGAGFPAGLKWSFIPPGIKPVYIAVNADESEPGTFKDRELMENNPHQFIEGIILCAYAVGAEAAYIYGRGEFKSPFVKLQKAVDEAYQKGFLGKSILSSILSSPAETGFSLDIHLHLGAGAYICGEEAALLSSLEGEMGQPRARPPFPAVEGLYAKPTVINNVETLTNVPPIVCHGAEWYRQYGTERSPGTKIFCLSGHINNPGNYELPLGTPLRFLIEELGGGVPGGKSIKGILPAGVSAPILMADKIDTPLDYESVQAACLMLGSASFIIMDETVDIVWATQNMTHSFKQESCGKCSPCREGTYWLEQVLMRISSGQGTIEDVDLLTDITHQMSDNCFCLLGDFATSSVNSSMEHFRDEYLQWINMVPEK